MNHSMLESAARPEVSLDRTSAAARILILDFGGQYTQLIARRVREAGVYCEIYPHDVSEQKLRVFAPRASFSRVVPSRSPSSKG